MGRTLCQCQAGKEKAKKKPSCLVSVSREMQRLSTPHVACDVYQELS